MTTTLAAVIVVAVVLIVGILMMAARQRRSNELRERFGPEYDRTVSRFRRRDEAESELEARRRRVEELDIRALSADDQHRFADEWRIAQAHFVDNPSAAIRQADDLVQRLMQARGYPVGNFEQRTADISVNHPSVVTNYRAAHRIALSDVDGNADTESLRTAMTHYRALFEELLETRVITDIEQERQYRARAS